MQHQSLRERNPRRLGVPVLAIIALALLVTGLSMPVLTVDVLGPAGSTHSVISGVVELVRGGNVILGSIIGAFSVVFPVVKLIAILAIWFMGLEAAARRRIAGILEFLGKWSMLDVYVVVLLAGAVQFGVLAEARAEAGIYVFAVAIIVSLIATSLTARVIDAGFPRSVSRPASIPASVRVLGALALPIYVAALCAPVMKLEEWIFWDSEYSVITGTWQLWRAGEVVLALVVTVFVIVLPLANATTLAVLALRRASVRGLRFLHALNRWSMIDVFALAVLVVLAKAGDLAHIELRIGVWVFAAAGSLSAYVGWRLDRLVG